MEKEYLSHSEAETEKIGAMIASEIKQNEFIALYGEMASGKTVFMRGFVSKLVPTARVSSPTYAILNVYTDGEKTVNHFDMYRIESEDDLESIAFYDVCENGVSVCEWAEKIPFALPEHFLKITFSKPDAETRRLVVERI